MGDHPDGVGIEGHGNRRTVDRIGPFDHLVEKGLVADMHPIEITDGHYRILERFYYVLDVLNNFHGL